MMKYSNHKILWLQTLCNKQGQQAGLGEPGLNKVTLTYWMAAQDLKASQPNASQEQILFSILDDHKCSIVPWRGHAFSASLGKIDHGTNMLTGLVPTTDGEEFDPLVHIDLLRCTVSFESWATNKSKYNYDDGD